MVEIVPFAPPVQACNAGLFVSRGQGRHGTRIIESHELIFVRSGTLGMFEDRRRFTLRAGQALLLRAGRRHGGTLPYPPDLRFYWIHFRLRPEGGTRRAAHTLRLPSQTTVSRPDRLTELFRLFLDDQENDRLTPLTADLLLLLMLSEVANTRPDDPTAATASSLAGRAELLIRLHADTPLSTASLAAELRCNPDYLGRIFHQTNGRTLTAAIHAQRHRRARAMLLEDNRSIKEIARACGFDDAGYFRRLFRRQEGLSPSAYRRLYARMHVNLE